VRALTVFRDGLHAGGSFTSAIDSGDSFLARWQGCLDTTAPVLTVPESVIVIDLITSPPGQAVTFEVTASDVLDPAPSIVCVPPSGSVFPPGTTLVTCTATDAAGNHSSRQFPVTVRRKSYRR